MKENEIEPRIRRAFDAGPTKACPSFDVTWAAAEVRYRRERRRYAAFGGVAAILAVVVVGLSSIQESPLHDEFLIADAFLNSTQWSAPSDVLLPQHQYDLYRELPILVEPTDIDEGSLL